MSNPSENAFEDHIADWLATKGGFDAVKPGPAGSQDLDADTGLDTAELMAFIGQTQGAEWDRLCEGFQDPAEAQQAFKARLSEQIDKRGTVDVLRNGITYAETSYNLSFDLAYFRPAADLNPDLNAKYQSNRVTCTRQLMYESDSKKSLDLATFVNGIPVVTVELKNILTGQNVNNAIQQYSTDRDASNPLLRRSVVHFAVDSEEVFMSTKLAGKKTRFLPFNMGNQGSAGNPPTDGYRTSYLWEEVLERSSLLDLLQNFIVASKPKPKRGKKKPEAPSLIFPRFHQWDAVTNLTQAALRDGPGHSYLVQHSAGSGKSNTIAWLSYRLKSLFNGSSQVFDKVIVVTDRRVLDKQLQDTISSIEHVPGVVQRIDEDSKQLAAALTGEQSKIVITTLQKFPYVMRHVAELKDRNYAVVVDEAHSSQTGESAKEMKAVLGLAGELPAEGQLSLEDLLAAEVKARGKQPNMSFFAFTATPKAKTLEIFGTENGHGKPEAFHLYSMRQAIEEGFIHDVLANYITYDEYYEVEQTIADDPRYKTSKARKAIAKFARLHESNLSQKAQVIVDHFEENVKNKIGGQAKAMVVTSSREHALKFKRTLDKYCAENGKSLKTLVAFSGSLDEDGEDITESKANGFPESQTKERFDTDEFQILVVAEKYQTGFDQPKLYAMYVDKQLGGLAAVQTLARLNRTMAGKDGTFVLDFANTTDDIRNAFEPWYERTMATPSDPNWLFDTWNDVAAFQVIDDQEVETFLDLLLRDKEANHQRIYGALTPAHERFMALDEAEAIDFRDVLKKFISTYSYLSQVVTYGDTKLEGRYRFAMALGKMISSNSGGMLDLSDELRLTKFELRETFAGSASLTGSDGEVSALFAGGGLPDDDEDALSVILAKFNEAHGTDFSESSLLKQPMFEGLAKDKSLLNAINNNTEAEVDGLLEDGIKKSVLDHGREATELRDLYLDDTVFQENFNQLYSKALRVEAQGELSIEQLIAKGEGQYIEFKSSLQIPMDVKTGQPSGGVLKPLRTAVIKTIAGFMNSLYGGTLLIGVMERNVGGKNITEVCGLDAEYEALKKEGKDPRDRFIEHLAQLTMNAVGQGNMPLVVSDIVEIDGKEVCRVQVKGSKLPVEAEVLFADKSGKQIKDTCFFGRTNGRTIKISDDQREVYEKQVWD